MAEPDRQRDRDRAGRDQAGRDHAGHDHGAVNQQRTFWAALLTGGFMVAEAAGGLIAGSLALLADAGHMLTDSVSLGLAWYAFRLAHKPADPQRSYGFDRFQILVAFANGLTLVFIVAWILIEAARRFFEPVEVLGGTMLVIAILGLLVNIGAFLLLHGADRNNLNIKGALLHVMGDLLGSVAALVAALVIMATGWMPIDPILSVAVALLILRSAVRLIRESGHVLLEGTPRDLDPAEIRRDLMEHVEAIEDVHHVHAWSLTQEKPLMTLHVKVAPQTRADVVVRHVTDRLADRFGIGHVTVQIEHEVCADAT
ncbi:MAG: cation diffusion facilitator family transporter [Geminicoccaceae bacterium]|nr:cation diffusion facilitator family transporter [Geminicoccaceae bacterium]